MTLNSFHWVLVTVAWAALAACYVPDGMRCLLLLHITGALWLGGRIAGQD